MLICHRGAVRNGACLAGKYQLSPVLAHLLAKERIEVIPLFEQYPLLRERLPYIPLGEFPTPVQKLDQLGTELGLSSVWEIARRAVVLT